MPFSAKQISEAFSPGAKVWFIDSDNTSLHRQKLDWYLNFLFLRAENHEQPVFSPQLKSFINENNLPEFYSNLKNQNNPLMVPAQKNIPTDFIIEIGKLDDSKNWVMSLYQSCMKLNLTPVRIFLPKSLKIDEFKQHWPVDASQNLEIELIQAE